LSTVARRARVFPTPGSVCGAQKTGEPAPLGEGVYLTSQPGLGSATVSVYPLPRPSERKAGGAPEPRPSKAVEMSAALADQSLAQGKSRTGQRQHDQRRRLGDVRLSAGCELDVVDAEEPQVIGPGDLGIRRAADADKA